MTSASLPADRYAIEFNGDGCVQLHSADENTLIVGADTHLDDASYAAVADPISHESWCDVPFQEVRPNGDSAQKAAELHH